MTLKIETTPLGRHTDEKGTGVMATAARSKASAAKRHATKGGRKAEPEKRKLNRAGSLINADLSQPMTIGQRMTVRRLQLGMTQEEVASKVIFVPKSGTRRGDEIVLSRNAYCMYETHNVAPDLQKIEEIAKALQVSPGWLAFGIAEDKKVMEYVYDPHKKSFVPEDGWVISPKWLKAQYNMEPEKLCLYMISDYSENFVAGDVAIVEKDAEPTAIAHTFIFFHKGEIKSAIITKPARSDSIRVFSPDLKSHDEIALKNVNILGKVIGRIGKLEKN